STPIADVIDKVEGRETIYQPPNLSPTASGVRVPKGEFPPVGETITAFPGHPGEAIIHYGTEPNGETLPDKVVPENTINPYSPLSPIVPPQPEGPGTPPVNDGSSNTLPV
ncbi:MAG: hypothetical protein ACREGF_00365, partial [Candidatus Saccharimonadales bacterium]